MDYRAWTDSVRSFSEALRHLPGDVNVTIEIDAPASESKLLPIAEKWPRGLPEALRRLWTEGSSKVNCPYAWTPPPNELPMLKQIFKYENWIYGGVRFEAPEDVFPGNSGADPDDVLARDALGDIGFALWCSSAVFLHIGNGDCLGLDPHRSPDDPAVVYLIHDDTNSRYVSRSFTQFLTAWATLSFIGPEIWLLQHWLDCDTDSIEPAKYLTTELRTLLSPRLNAKE